jgi:hypothetical protein
LIEAIASTSNPAEKNTVMPVTMRHKRGRMIWGLSLHGWEELMRGSLLAVGALGVVVGLATTFVVTLTREELEQSKRELDAYKLTTDGKVADARKEGIEAGKTAGDALVRAAELEKKAAELTAANLALEALIEPRTFGTAEKAIEWGRSLAKFAGKKIKVLSQPNDLESATLGRNIVFALQQGGELLVRDETMQFQFPGIAYGISVSGDDNELVEALIAALRTKFEVVRAALPDTKPHGAGMVVERVNPIPPPDATILVGVKGLQYPTPAAAK